MELPNYTILPWMKYLSAGRIVSVALAVLAVYCLAEQIFKRRNITMRKGTLSLINNTVWPLIINSCIFAVAYWYWALPLALICGLVFIFIIKGELRTAYQEELEGYRGLFPAIRKIRAEAFADLPIEEQMEYKKSVKPHKFYWWIWLPLIVIIPFLLMLLLEQLGIGDYLFARFYFPEK